MATNNAVLAQLAQTIGRLDMIQRELQKMRNVLSAHDNRIADLEIDLSEAMANAEEETVYKERAHARVARTVPEPEEKLPDAPLMSIKRRFAGKFAVQNADGKLLTDDLSLEEAQAELARLRTN